MIRIIIPFSGEAAQAVNDVDPGEPLPAYHELVCEGDLPEGAHIQVVAETKPPDARTVAAAYLVWERYEPEADGSARRGRARELHRHALEVLERWEASGMP